MRRLVDGAGLADRVTLDSAGTGGWHVGQLADPRTREAAARRGVALVHRARQFTRADVDRFDLVVVMDRQNLGNVARVVGELAAPIVQLLRSFDPTAEPDAEVPDPYSGGSDGFEEVLDQCERACRGLLDHVRGRVS